MSEEKKNTITPKTLSHRGADNHLPNVSEIQAW
jgi:hypothetical protein